MISNAFWLLTTLVGLAILVRFEAGVVAAILSVNWKLCRFDKKVHKRLNAKPCLQTPSLGVTI